MLDALGGDARDVIRLQVCQRIAEVFADLVLQEPERPAACDAKCGDQQGVAHQRLVEIGFLGNPGGRRDERVFVGHGHLVERADRDLGEFRVLLQHGVRRRLHVLAARHGARDRRRHLRLKARVAAVEDALDRNRGRGVKVEADILREIHGMALRRLFGRRH